MRLQGAGHEARVTNRVGSASENAPRNRLALRQPVPGVSRTLLFGSLVYTDNVVAGASILRRFAVERSFALDPL